MIDSPEKAPVFVIVPVHNRKATTLACLENLQKSGAIARYHILVVDDGSTDGTTAAIHAHYPDVTVLSGDGDLWWTGAMHQGMTYADEQGAKVFIWLNDDCIPAEQTLPLLVDFVQQHPTAIAAAACYAANTGLLVETGFRGRQRLTAQPGETIAVAGISGYCVAIPVAVFERIGPPDLKHSPHYAGDSIYTLRATKAGFSAFILGSAPATLLDEDPSIHSFRHYYQTVKSPSWNQLFLNKKSPYHLPAQFFYYREKYGFLVGTALFLAKSLLWLLQWSQLQLRDTLNRMKKFRRAA